LRVVLGATLALAGDAARREAAPPGDAEPEPPRAAKKTRATLTLPQPHFADHEAPAASPHRRASIRGGAGG
jgi:hypothetical protein